MVRKKLSKKAFGIVISGTLFAVILLSFYIWHQVEAIRVGYKTRELEKQVVRLREEVKTLEALKVSLLSLERVEKIAQEELNLSSPGENQILYEQPVSESTSRKR